MALLCAVVAAASGARLAAEQVADTLRTRLVRDLQALIASGPTGHATPEDVCAYRVVNPQLTPPGFLQSFPNADGCRGK